MRAPEITAAVQSIQNTANINSHDIVDKQKSLGSFYVVLYLYTQLLDRMIWRVMF